MSNSSSQPGLLVICFLFFTSLLRFHQYKHWVHCSPTDREMQEYMILQPEFFKNTILVPYKTSDLSLKLHSINGDSTFVCQVYFVPFLLPGCLRWEFPALLLYSHCLRFLFLLCLNLFVCVTGKIVVYIFVVNKRGLHLTTILLQCSANVIFILRAACLNCLQPFIAALCLCQHSSVPRGIWLWTWMFRLRNYENEPFISVLC